jgi:pimeloyl-ACP methyl ester carboxylesterase
VDEPQYQTITLADGRRLAWAEYGDPAGRPVLYAHGGLASRLDFADLADRFAELGVRLIAPDRPGIGHSDFQPGRRLLDWPNDAAALLDHLGVERCATLGWSAGGPYAAACAYALGDRVTGVGLLGSAVPFEVIGSRKGLNRPDRVMLTLATRVPPLARAALWLTLAAPPPPMLVRLSSRALSPADRRVLQAAPPEQAVAFMKEAVRQGTRGEVQEYVVFARPWGFRLEDVKAPVWVWEGEEDTMLPLAYPETLAAHLSRCTVTVVPGEGHLSLLRARTADILSPLVEPL